MGIIATLLVTVTLSVGTDPNLYHAESWKNPTMEELQICADMAADMTDTFVAMVEQGLNKDWQSQYATCELTPFDENAAEPANYSGPAPIPSTLKF